MANAQWITGPTSITFSSLLIGFLNIVWVAFTFIAVVSFVAAGLMFLTAFGDSEKLTKARSAVIWGVVGIIVALLAWGIINIIRTAISAV